MDAEKQLRWDRHFLALALQHAQLSRDPSTRVGAIIVGPDREFRSGGFNGFPREIKDTPERLNDRAMKYRLVVHGEMNAVLAAARVGIPLLGCTMYLMAQNAVTGETWGGNPCTRCTVECLQAGITEFVSLPIKNSPSSWHEDVAFARTLIEEAGARYREVNLP